MGLTITLSVIITFVVTAIVMGMIYNGEFTVNTKAVRGNTISWFDQWMYQRILQRNLIQGNHTTNLRMFHKILITEAHREFTEDNNITLIDWINGCQNEAIDELGMNITVHLSNDGINSKIFKAEV